ncbi:hypothetical protein D9619_012832 [Psilocybe cf. subviscida]|uniref:Uncharacterized protein n=1 Tax=Psilocybe cf. subviscida TaxID=2480587 RepID=A0A8H5AQS7_9AGAR|nr:hypothetical protein D9619_012832 [Psilocybe cf. subviscida]
MGIERTKPPAAPSITTSHNPSPPLSSSSTPSLYLYLAHHEFPTKLTLQAIGTHPSAPECIAASSAACSITSQSLSTPSTIERRRGQAGTQGFVPERPSRRCGAYYHYSSSLRHHQRPRECPRLSTRELTTPVGAPSSPLPPPSPPPTFDPLFARKRSFSSPAATAAVLNAQCALTLEPANKWHQRVPSRHPLPPASPSPTLDSPFDREQSISSPAAAAVLNAQRALTSEHTNARRQRVLHHLCCCYRRPLPTRLPVNTPIRERTTHTACPPIPLPSASLPRVFDLPFNWKRSLKGKGKGDGKAQGVSANAAASKSQEDEGVWEVMRLHATGRAKYKSNTV